MHSYVLGMSLIFTEISEKRDFTICSAVQEIFFVPALLAGQESIGYYSIILIFIQLNLWGLELLYSIELSL